MQAAQGRRAPRGLVVWITGLPGSGKSTLASAVHAALDAGGTESVILDGDKLREDLCADLGFSVEDRMENIRRVGAVARLFMLQGTVALVALVSPIRSARDRVRATLADGEFVEVYCNSPFEVCRARDPKGMYARAAQGLIPQFTGVSAPYEAPLSPELVLDTGHESVDASVQRLLSFVRARHQPG